MFTLEKPSVEGVRLLQQRQAVDRLDYLRGIRELAASMTQTELAKRLGLAQPSISSALRTAVKVPDVRPGFSGASPYEIAQRYAAGELPADQVVDELARWEYVPRPATDGYDWLTAGSDVGTWAEVEKALRDGLLEDATYDAILERQDELNR
jgi:hypothetical protein